MHDIGLDWEALVIAARTVEGEAGGETPEGKLAVACVIVNRACKGGWWGSTIAKVCKRRWQFSCWNEGDPNRARIERKTLAQLGQSGCFDAVLRAMAVAGTTADPSGGSCHYYAKSMAKPPAWARGKAPTREIGGHLFFAGLA